MRVRGPEKWAHLLGEGLELLQRYDPDARQRVDDCVSHVVFQEIMPTNLKGTLNGHVYIDIGYPGTPLPVLAMSLLYFASFIHMRRHRSKAPTSRPTDEDLLREANEAMSMVRGFPAWYGQEEGFPAEGVELLEKWIDSTVEGAKNTEDRIHGVMPRN